jgi:hypothetical protein
MLFKRMKFKIKPHIVILATILLGAQLGLATPVLIDKFLTPSTILTLSDVGNAHTSQSVAAAEVIGGARILDLAWRDGTVGFESSFRARGTPVSVLTLNSDNGVTASGLASYCGTLTCGATPGAFDGLIGTTTPTAFGLGGVDLTSAGTNTQIRIIGNSDQIVTIWATFYQGNTGTVFARTNFTIPGDIVNHTYSLRFDNTGDALYTFAGGATSGLFTNVSAVTFLIEGSNSSDTFISYFGADNAPEPASFGMLGAGLSGLIWYARKRAQPKN